MRIVLDTNVLVSGLLTPFGKCGQIVRMLTSGELTLCVDSRILVEYAEVLNRPHFCMDRSRVETVLYYIRASAETHASVPLSKPLPDAGDSPFLEVGISSGAECLVTGNPKHFPPHCRAGVRVVWASEFLDFLASRRGRH